MIWDSSQDDYLGKCGSGTYPLLTTISKGLGIVSKGHNIVIVDVGIPDSGTIAGVHYVTWIMVVFVVAELS